MPSGAVATLTLVSVFGWSETSPVVIGIYLELDHGAKVVVPKKDAEFPLLHRGGELT